MAGHAIDHEAAKEKCLQALRAGNTREASHTYAGFSSATFWRWRQEDEEFEEKVKEAEASWQVRSVAQIGKAAGEGTWQAAAWLLERHPLTKQAWKRIDQHDMSSIPSNRLLEMLSLVEEGAESAGDTAARAEAESHAVPE